MSKDNVVSNNVGLSAGAPLFAVEVAKNGASARRMDPAVVSLHGHGVRLVESDPALHPVPKRLETRVSICHVVVAACIQKPWQPLAQSGNASPNSPWMKIIR